MKHLKKFSTDTDRIAYESSNDYIEPYISLVRENRSSHYNVPFFCKLTLNDGSIVRLIGSGELTSSMISSYKSTCTEVEIGKLCTSIESSAFWECTSLTSVTIPNSVTSIGGAAFAYCNNLKSIICEGYIENIGLNVFNQTVSESQLETVEFRGGIGTSGKSIFWGCVNLKIIKYNSNTLPTYNITSTQTPWGSTTAANTCGYTNRTAGTNIFYCPSTSTYTEAEIDPYNSGSLFSTEYSGFTISRTL